MTHQASRHIATAKKIHPAGTVKLSVIIPATSVGYRMKSYGPISLIEVKNSMTLLETQLHAIWTVYPNAEVIVITGCNHDKFLQLKSQYPIRLINNPVYETTNMMLNISIGLQAALGIGVLIVPGDVCFNAGAIDGTECSHSNIVVDIHGQMGEDGVGYVQNRNVVTNLSFGLDSKWSQIVYLTGRELEMLTEIAYDTISSKHLFLYEGLNRVIDRGGKFIVHHNQSQHLKEIGNARDIETLRGNDE